MLARYLTIVRTEGKDSGEPQLLFNSPDTTGRVLFKRAFIANLLSVNQSRSRIKEKEKEGEKERERE